MSDELRCSIEIREDETRQSPGRLAGVLLTRASDRAEVFEDGALRWPEPDAVDVAHNEAVVRLAGYLFDQPNAGRGVVHADALRNSGARAILLPLPHPPCRRRRCRGRELTDASA